MNIDNLLDLSTHMVDAGFTLNLEEICIIKNSLKLLQYENHFKTVYFWGKILGIHKNYFIAFGYKENCILDKTYFYCTDLIQWVMLNKITKTSKSTNNSFNFLSGDPITYLMTSTTYSQNSEGFLEEQYLSNVIFTISQEAEIVPRGYFIKNNLITENRAFHGLSLKNSLCLTSYFHYRKSIHKWNTIALTKKDFHYPIDFLDSIDTDIPKGCWVLSQEVNSNIITLKSLLWPGMVFLLKPNSLNFGFVYIGNGNKNLDLPFMI